jgi:protein TonB
MLESSLFESCSGHSTKKHWTISASLTLHILALTAMVLLPFIHTSALSNSEIFSRPIPMSIKEDIVNIVPSTAKPKIIKIPEVHPNDLIAPPVIPQGIAIVVDPPSPSSEFSIPSATTIGSLLPSLMPTETVPPAPTPPPPAPLEPTATHAQVDPVRVSNGVQQANLIHQVRPEYPPIARQVRAQGVVVLEAVINKNGAIDHLRVISGHPLLVQAALDAVSQWKYRPTLLNGEPVEVITTITATFSLSQP